jgi:haloacetate dehalogenase
VGKDLATAYYHWFFFIQPYDLPETLIGAEPGYYLRKKLGGWGTSLDTFAPEALAEYERCFDAATIHASCEDYRASASIDLVHDEADLDEARKVLCPLLALWGGQGVMERIYDVEAVWREYASHARGKPIDAGHFLAEERPAETTQELTTFLQEQSI